jgi:hypothetical protein
MKKTTEGPESTEMRREKDKGRKERGARWDTSVILAAANR